MRQRHDPGMRPLFCLLALALTCAVTNSGLAQTSDGAPTDWYGVRIGDVIPPGDALPGEGVWPGPLPGHWNSTEIAVDSDRRISEIWLNEGPQDIVNTGPRRSRSKIRAAPSPEARGYYEHGISVRAYAIARLGVPRSVTQFRYQGKLKWASLRWDFTDRFVRCEGGKSFYEATSPEPTGLIAEASLDYNSGGVRLSIIGKNASGRDQDLPEQYAKSCRPTPPEEDPVGKIGEELRDFCTLNPDRCVSSIPGVTIIPAPNTTVVPAPCPKGTKNAVCYRGKEIQKSEEKPDD